MTERAHTGKTAGTTAHPHNSGNPAASTAEQPASHLGGDVSPVTIDRIVAACAQNGMSLTTDRSGRAAHGEHEELVFMVVLLDSVFIVRADTVTDSPADTADPTFFLAANEVNSTLLGARAIVGNRDDMLVVRTEADVACAAGMNNAQLRSAASRATDAVVSAHNAMRALAEQIESAQQAIRQDVAGEQNA